tara:strand:+ start:248 stop:460 length:213 start_codon:yes stop_codon:yes gene_type:complete
MIGISPPEKINEIVIALNREWDHSALVMSNALTAAIAALLLLTAIATGEASGYREARAAAVATAALNLNN